MAKTIFYSLAALVRKFSFCHSKVKFISSRHRVISSIYYIYTEKYSPKSYVVNFRTQISSSQSEKRTMVFTLACENIRSSSLFVAGDVSCGGTCATQRHKFHTDDVKSVRNLVRSADWSTQQLHCFNYCL